MKIPLPARSDVPATNLFAKVLTAANSKLGDRAVILLVPGGPGGNHTVFDAIQDELLQYGDIILFDPRGCGYSEASNSKYCSIDHYIEDIEAIRQHFKLSKMILLGGSYGSMAAVGYAVKYSANLEKLVLISGASSYRFLETAKQNLKKNGTTEQVEAAKDLFAGTFKSPEHFKRYYQTMSSLYLYKQSKEEKSPPTIKPNVPYNVDVLNLGFGDFLRGFNFEQSLKNIECETLILVGKHDWINDPIHSKYMADNIPNAELVVLDECGHFIWADQKENFLLALDNFLLEHKPRLAMGL